MRGIDMTEELEVSLTQWQEMNRLSDDEVSTMLIMQAMDLLSEELTKQQANQWTIQFEKKYILHDCTMIKYDEDIQVEM